MIDNRSEMAVYFLSRLTVYKECIRLPQLSSETGFSISYLETMARQLRTAGFIKSTRGPKGGYSIAKHEEEIYLVDVFAAVKLNNKRRLAEEQTSVVLNEVTDRMISRLTLYSVLARLPGKWKK